MLAPEEMTRRYQEALDSFVEKVKQDRLILAAILCGSLSYDQVWEKSDIDLLLVGREDVKAVKDYCLTENGVNIHALLYPRSKFRSAIEGSLQSSFFHSYFSKSTLLYTTDDSIKEYYNDIHRIGARDREVQLLRAGTMVLPSLAKAEKWFYVKKDYAYCFLYIMYTIDGLARIETILNGEVTGREVIHQALKFNPDFFRTLYVEFVDQKKDAESVGRALSMIDKYMDEKKYLLFKPILDYLSEAGGIRSTTELDTYFKTMAQAGGLSFAYEWLSDKGIIQKVPTPVHLTDKSRATVDEAAYYYDGEEMS